MTTALKDFRIPAKQISEHQKAVEEEFRTHRQHLQLCARAGTGKCLGRGTPVLLYDGTIRVVEDIEPGDLLMGPDSKPRTVASIAAGYGQLYRVIPVKGDPWVCNADHVLTLAGTNHVHGQTRDVPLNKYLEELALGVAHCNSWKLVRAAVNFPQQDKLPVPPYLAGLWMGDGSRGTPYITNSNPIVHEYCRAVAAELKVICNIKPDKRAHKKTSRIEFVSKLRSEYQGRKTAADDNPLRTFFRRCTVGSLKKVPSEYLTASWEDRMQLLAGILDTDSEDTGNSNTFVNVTGELYRDDLLFLCRSLGFAAYCGSSEVHTCANGRVSTYYLVSIAGDLDKIPTKVRKFPERRQIKRVTVTGFELEDVGEGDYFGFELDGDGRFLLGDFTVTHNTTILRHLSAFTRPGEDQVVYLAFNRKNAREGERKMPSHVTSVTAHAYCNQLLRRHGLGGKPDGRKTWKLLDYFYPHFGNPEKKRRRRACNQLVNLCKNFALRPEQEQAIHETAVEYSLDLLPDEYPEIVDLAGQLLQCSLPGEQPEELPELYDFNDMVWWPVMLGLEPPKQDVVLADEVQDFNNCQIWLLERLADAGSRIVSVGDPNQAVYAFRGADANAFAKLHDTLAGLKAGCKDLLLPVNYRCGTKILAHVRETTNVKDIQAWPGASEGVVRTEPLYADLVKDLVENTQPGQSTTVLCRTNYPLMRCALKLIQSKYPHPLNLVGRDVGNALKNIIDDSLGRQRTVAVAAFANLLDAWWVKTQKRLQELQGEERRLSELEDMVDCLSVLCERAGDTDELRQEIDSLFVDQDQDHEPGTLLLCSGHRSKGLEWDRVLVLKTGLLPHPLAETERELVQEDNISYVIRTRARHELVLCPDPEPRAVPK